MADGTLAFPGGPTYDLRLAQRGGLTEADLLAVDEIPLERELVVAVDTRNVWIGNGTDPLSKLNPISRPDEGEGGDSRYEPSGLALGTRDLLDRSYATHLSVRAYGAKGDGVTDDYAAFRAALDACEDGQVVFVPAGVYMISQTLFLTKNQTIEGVHNPRWAYDGGMPSSLACTDNFTGLALISLKDMEEGGYAAEQDGIRVHRLTLDGREVGDRNGNPIAGLRASGQIRDFRAIDLSINHFTGNGFHVVGYQRQGGYIHAKGFTLHRVAVWQCHNNGFSFNDLTDGVYEDCLAVANYANGFYITGSGENQYFLCRAVFNGAAGFVYTGSHTGGIFTCCTTDRNASHGFLHSATGTNPLVFNGLIARRDGSKSATAGYAGLAVIGAGTTDAQLASPVWINAYTSAPGLDDPVGGNAPGGIMSPQYGVTVKNARFVSVGGMPWGVNEAVHDDGGNVIAPITVPGTLTVTGPITAPVRVVEPRTAKALRAAPTVTAMPLNGTGAPAPTLAAGSTAERGTILFGSGTTPAAGSQVQVAFPQTLDAVPTILVGATTGGAASRAPFPSNITQTGFTINLNSAPTASQAGTTYGVSYQVVI